jgi:hypothetical protein
MYYTYSIELDEEILDTENMEMINKHYYIGSYSYIQEENNLLFDNKIQVATFMKYDSYEISNYLFESSIMQIYSLPSIEILQLHILPDDTYSVVIKTFWIKIIQRAWKRVYKQRQKLIQSMKNVNSIRRRELGQTNRINLPSIYGLLTP